jgi:predicted nucleotidyltransferase
MRLTAKDAATIREEVRRLDPAAEVYLFGSRTDDRARGGDIDLLVISDRLNFCDVLHLRIAILDRIGWQQMDLLVRRRDRLTGDPLAAMAYETGVKL